MKWAAALLVALALPASSAADSATTKLAITVYPKGTGSTLVRHYSLACAPAAGTVPRPGRACLALARLADPFAPVPRGVLCAQLSLGPQEADVTGLVRGRRVAAHLSLDNGCQIQRWRRVSLVVPGFPASA